MTSNPRLQTDTHFAANMFPYKITGPLQESSFKSKLPKKPGNLCSLICLTSRWMRYGSKASYAYPRHSPHTAHRIMVLCEQAPTAPYARSVRGSLLTRDIKTTVSTCLGTCRLMSEVADFLILELVQKNRFEGICPRTNLLLIRKFIPPLDFFIVIVS